MSRDQSDAGSDLQPGCDSAVVGAFRTIASSRVPSARREARLLLGRSAVGRLATTVAAKRGSARLPAIETVPACVSRASLVSLTV